jgi:hypothetical protein
MQFNTNGVGVEIYRNLKACLLFKLLAEKLQISGILKRNS